MKKNSCTPINPKKYSCYGLKKIHTRNLITKKNSCGSKIPLPPHNFSNGPSLSSFDTHPRWPPVTQSLLSRRSYGKIGDCEQSIGAPLTDTKQGINVVQLLQNTFKKLRLAQHGEHLVYSTLKLPTTYFLSLGPGSPVE